MGRSAVHSVAVARGAMPTSGGYPDPASDTWVAFGVEKGFATFFGTGEDPVADIELVGATPDSYSPPTPANPKNTTGGALFGADAGELIRRLITDGIDLRFPMYNVDGVTFATHLAHPQYQILASVFGYEVPGAATDTVNGASADATTHTATTVAPYFIGEVLSVTRNGMTEYAVVTDIDGNDVSVYPDWEGGLLANGVTVRHHITFSPRTGAVSSSNYIHLRFDAEGLRRYAFNCVCTKVVIEPVEDSQNSGAGPVYMTATIRPGSKTVLTDNANAATVTYSPTGTGVATQLQACRRYGDDLVSALVEPAQGAASSWPLRKWTITLEPTITSDGLGCSPVIAESGVTRGRNRATIDFEAAGSDLYDRGIVDQEQRPYIIGCGPADDGFAFFLLSGHLESTEKFTEDDGETQVVSGVLRNGAWTIDDDLGDAAANPTANTSFRLGFPMP